MSIMILNAGNIFYFLYLISRAYLSRLKIDVSSPFLKLEPIDLSWISSFTSPNPHPIINEQNNGEIFPIDNMKSNKRPISPW